VLKRTLPVDKDVVGHVRVAMVGSGQMAGARSERLADSPHTSVVAVAARNQKTGKELAARHGVECTQDWMATVRRPDVDAVVLATHPDTRAEMGMAVLSAGKHLFTESPLALSPRDGSRLLALANENGLVIRVGHTSVIRPAQCLIREQMAALGGPVHDHAVVQPSDDARRGRRPGFDQRISGHPVVYAVILGLQVIYARGPIVEVSAGTWMDPDGDVFDRCAVHVTLMFEDRGLATISYRRGFSGQAQAGRNVLCRNGSITYIDGAGHITVTASEESRDVPVPEADPWREELDEFVESICAGRPMTISADEAMRVVSIFDAVCRHSNGYPVIPPL
jgi:predicted dehydrogenase